MNFNWLKSYMPRSLFGRSLLILLFPVVVLQLVVGVVFIQRHFAQVTTQMAGSVAFELKYAAELVEEMGNVEEARAALYSLEKPFNIGLELIPDEDVVHAAKYYFYDVSGRVLVGSLRERVNRPIAMDLTKSDYFVEVLIQTSMGTLEAIVPRGRVSATNPHQLLVMMIVTAIILTIISVLFLRNQVRPIRNLAEASEEFGKGRITEYRPSGATEVRRAGISFLAMRTRIERQIEKRTQMLSGVSHDLKTPLTRLKLSLAVMDESEEVHHMQRDVEEMEKMLDDFLAFARGDHLEDAETVDPIALIDQIVDDCRRSGWNIEYQTAVETPKSRNMILRAGAVSRAINNLLSNALHHGEQVSTIVRLTERELEVSVEDDGVGIPAVERENALKPFVRLDESRNQNSSGGVGLGLAIAADVARSHGGSVELSTSEKLGGLKATFSIPR